MGGCGAAVGPGQSRRVFHTQKDRAMLGGFTSVVHAAASASWLRLLHARNPAALAVAGYDAARLVVARGAGAQEIHATFYSLGMRPY